ncbi:hypothetical protein COLO4_15158 [Corchorus olitorius]|uniref:Uncharacterized protein n=1 Tax=Corchorus olitorius TaxID=93759 RepID=A0A1R3JPD3_9ROSI|nr:hypothetical protein COLO4_15158 [Corchorus olitorius]
MEVRGATNLASDWHSNFNSNVTGVFVEGLLRPCDPYKDLVRSDGIEKSIKTRGIKMDDGSRA